VSVAGWPVITLAGFLVSLLLALAARRIATVRVKRTILAELGEERLESVRRDEQRHAEWLRQTNGRGY
jgi:hypothetical protein